MTEAKKTAQEELAKYLGARMRTVSEAEKRLREKEYEEEEIREAISEFLSHGYLDDYNYAVTYCEYAYGKRRGKRRIALELEQKGIDRNTIENAIEDYRYENKVDEFQSAMEVAERVLEDREEVDQRLLLKISRKLNQLGYENGTVMKVLERVKR